MDKDDAVSSAEKPSQAVAPPRTGAQESAMYSKEDMVRAVQEAVAAALKRQAATAAEAAKTSTQQDAADNKASTDDDDDNNTVISPDNNSRDKKKEAEMKASVKSLAAEAMTLWSSPEYKTQSILRR
jgi:hypothetical protein